MHIWRPLWVGGRQKRDVVNTSRREWGLTSVLDVQSFFFVVKESWICAMTRSHAEPNINILLTRNLPFHSYVRQWSQSLIIPLHYLWAKSNNRTRGQFHCDATWFCFCFDFVHSHTRWGCCSIVCLSFQVVQIKLIDCKLSTLLCLNVLGGGFKLQIFLKNPGFYKIIIREWPKNSTPF